MADGAPPAPAGAIHAISDSKLVAFAIGTQKKSRFQKAREEQEAKKKQDELEAAKVYETFVASFSTDDGNVKKFVRGGGDSDIYQMNGGRARPDEPDYYQAHDPQKESMDPFKARSASAAAPPVPPPASSSSSFTSMVPSSSSRRDKRQLDDLLDEFKNRQDSGSQSQPNSFAGRHSEGSYDDGDPTTTNLYVGNLKPTVTEQDLERLFSRYGEVNSVKIMWPRTEEERTKKRHSGFVNFVRRADADDARIELNDYNFHGYKIMVGWGKAIKVPPTFSAVTSTSQVASLAGDRSGKYGRSLDSREGGSASPDVFPSGRRSGPKNWDVAPGPHEPLRRANRMQVFIPRERRVQDIIDQLAQSVAMEGEAIEQAVRTREAGNPSYAFLNDPASNNAIYYRWRIYANAHGGTPTTWSMEDYQLDPDGPWYCPPTMPRAEVEYSARRDRTKSFDQSSRRSPSRSRSSGRWRGRGRKRSRSCSRSYSRSRSRSRSPHQSRGGRRSRSRSRSCSRSRSYSRSRSRSRETRRNRPTPRYEGLTGAQIEKERAKERTARRTRLSRQDFQHWMLILQQLSVSKRSIQEAMGFAYDHIECAEEIVRTIVDRLLAAPCHAAVKVAALYLFSDLLHNSATPIKYATNYKTLTQAVLPEIFESLAHSMRTAGGRMSQLAIEDRVRKVLFVWRDWSIFPETYLSGLEAMLYFSEQDVSLLRDYVQQQAGFDVPSDALEVLNKKAKQWAVQPAGGKISPHETQYKLNYVERYVQQAQKATKGRIDALLPVRTDSETMDAAVDVDGEALEEDYDRENARNGEEDLDGVPLEMDAIDGEPMGDADIDGVPLDDLDGEPMED